MSRLGIAIQRQSLEIPKTGNVLVIGVAGDAPMDELPIERVQFVQGFWPDFDRLTQRGCDVRAVPPDGTPRYAAALVHIGRSRSRSQEMIGQAAGVVSPGGLVIVDGEKTDGIDAHYKAVRARLAVLGALAKAHGRIFWFPAGPNFADWADLAANWPRVGRFHTAPGIFSADGIDPASAALAAALPQSLPGFGADLGAGWGYLADAALARDDVRQIDLVEADNAALAAARQNISDPRARFHWADATCWRPDRALDWVICNPPFHHGRSADPALGRSFIRRASEVLAPSGSLWLVANRRLPYESVLAERFSTVSELPAPPGFKIMRAERPRAPAPAAQER